jgi:hypothetical protein
MDFRPNVKRDVIWKPGWRDLAECYVKVKVPGVTSVISEMIPDPGIEQWIKDVGPELADKITQAANYRGTAMHCFIENWLIEMKRSLDPSKALKFTQIESPKILITEDVPERKIKEGRDLFYKFLDSNYSKQYSALLGTETNIHSNILFYRGKIDWLYDQEKYGLSVSDFKSASKPIEPGTRKELGYKCQLGGYALAIDHMLLEKDPNTTQKVNFSSIISVHTKSNLVQHIVLHGDELQEYKDKFETICKEYHIKHGQEFLI